MRSGAFLLLLTASVAWGQATTATPPGLNDLVAARDFAMAGAFNALGYGAEAIDANPAGISVYKRFQMEVSGAWDPAQGYGFGGIGLIDSTNEVSGGLSYHFVTLGSGETRRTAHVATLASSYAIANFIHLGSSVRYQSVIGPFATNSVTINAGAIAQLFGFLQVGFSGHNLIDVGSIDVKRYFALSLAGQFGGYFSPVVEARADFNDPKAARFSISGGLEYLALQMFPLRIGYSYDGIANTQYIGAGIGFFEAGSGIDFGYRHEIGGNGGRMLALTVKLQLNN